MALQHYGDNENGQWCSANATLANFRPTFFYPKMCVRLTLMHPRRRKVFKLVKYDVMESIIVDIRSISIFALSPISYGQFFTT